MSRALFNKVIPLVTKRLHILQQLSKISVKLWATKNGFDYVSLSKNTLGGGLKVIKHTFFKEESASIGVELHKHPAAQDELLKLCRDVSLDGVSIVAIEKATGIVVGAAFNKLQVPPKPGNKNSFENFAANCKFEASKVMIQFMIDSDSACDLFKHHNIDCLLEIMFMASSSECCGLGIGRKLIEVSIDLAKELHNGNNIKVSIDNGKLLLKPVPKVVAAIFTSKRSQHIGKTIGFQRNAEISFEKFIFQGKSFASRIGGESPSCTIESIKL